MGKAYEIPGNTITLVPTTDFSEHRYKAVKPDAATGMALATATDLAVGILQTPGIKGEPCRVMTSGVSFVALGGTVAAGDSVQSDATGGIIKAAEGKVCGICLVGGEKGQIGCISIK